MVCSVVGGNDQSLLDRYRSSVGAGGCGPGVAGTEGTMTVTVQNPLHHQPDSDHAERSWPWVRTLLHSVFDQPDAQSVAAQYDRIIDVLADKLPKVADHLKPTREDLLAFTAFPKQIWRQIWSNNPRNGSTRSAGAPMSSGSSPTATR